MNNEEELTEVMFCYIIIHKSSNLRQKIKQTFEESLSSDLSDENVSSLLDTLDPKITSQTHKLGQISHVEIAFPKNIFTSQLNMKLFEERLLNDEEVMEVYKTFDSTNIKANQGYLNRLYALEMKIREIYTVLIHLVEGSIAQSKIVQNLKGPPDKETLRSNLMNELFFIEFRDYAKTNDRRDVEREDLVTVLNTAKSSEDLRRKIEELASATLRLQEHFNELARIPEAITLLAKFRNCIAHNRAPSQDDVANFEEAERKIDEVYESFLKKLKENEL
jgi:hypothetical protein